MFETSNLGVGAGTDGGGAALLSEATGLTLAGGEDLGVLAEAEPSRGGCTTSEGLAAGLFLLLAHPPVTIGAAGAAEYTRPPETRS